YRFVTTETWQYRIKQVGATLPLSGTQLNLATGLFTMLGVPAVLAVQPGFMALPDNGYTPNSLTDGNNVWKGTTSGPNTCNPPTLGFGRARSSSPLVVCTRGAPNGAPRVFLRRRETCASAAARCLRRSCC